MAFNFIFSNGIDVKNINLTQRRFVSNKRKYEESDNLEEKNKRFISENDKGSENSSKSEENKDSSDSVKSYNSLEVNIDSSEKSPEKNRWNRLLC